MPAIETTSRRGSSHSHRRHQHRRCLAGRGCLSRRGAGTPMSRPGHPHTRPPSRSFRASSARRVSLAGAHRGLGSVLDPLGKRPSAGAACRSRSTADQGEVLRRRQLVESEPRGCPDARRHGQLGPGIAVCRSGLHNRAEISRERHRREIATSHARASAVTNSGNDVLR